MLDAPVVTIDAPISDEQATTTTIDDAACRQGWVEHVWTVARMIPART